MKIRILYFGELREQVGVHEESVDLVAATRTVSDLINELTARGSVWASALQTDPLRIAVNQEMASLEAVLSPNCEVALFRPVTGG
ncbi:MAG: MoaD/ThiS family protein [Orrella sp.]|uniref:MoaD/ThiS family protein n=1 Tax=Orrella sp. TaxID=1921583 RepID=UPI003BBB0189